MIPVVGVPVRGECVSGSSHTGGLVRPHGRQRAGEGRRVVPEPLFRSPHKSRMPWQTLLIKSRRNAAEPGSIPWFAHARTYTNRHYYSRVDRNVWCLSCAVCQDMRNPALRPPDCVVCFLSGELRMSGHARAGILFPE